MFKGVFFRALFTLAACSGVSLSAYAAPEDEIEDPLEDMNRGIFWFNDQLDIHVLEPVARGYDEIVPERVDRSIGNFFTNLKYPSFFVSDVVQGKFDQAGTHTARFLINSTLGVLGLFDVAGEWGMEHHEEDFGIALAYRGVPPGPYIVLPLLGPSNVRDTVGTVVDTLLDPFTWIGYYGMREREEWATTLTAKGIKVVHTRAGLMQAIETAKESSLDYYLFMQAAYYQYRYGLLTDGAGDDEEYEDAVEGAVDETAEKVDEGKVSEK